MTHKITVGIAFYTMTIFLALALQNENSAEAKSAKQHNDFRVTSTAVQPDGSLLADFTGDGRGVSMPVTWTNPPENTKYFALNLWHRPHPITHPTEIKSYWVLYNIPGNIHHLPEAVHNIGENGYNDKDKTGFDPMRSKGPGKKIYNLTIYALSEKPVFNTKKVYRTDLLNAIKTITLAEATLTYTYERQRTDSQLQNDQTHPLKKTSPLTDLQKQKIKNILAQYDSDSLTIQDAKNIHKALHKAGIHAGPEINDIIEKNGFNPDKLRDLDPPVTNEKQ